MSSAMLRGMSGAVFFSQLSSNPKSSALSWFSSPASCPSSTSPVCVSSFPLSLLPRAVTSISLSVSDVARLVVATTASAASLTALYYLAKRLLRSFFSKKNPFNHHHNNSSSSNNNSHAEHFHTHHHSHEHEHDNQHQNSHTSSPSASSRRASQRARERAARFTAFMHDINSLRHSHGVVVVDPDTFYYKWQRMRAAGDSKLQIIADFDRTITKLKCSNGSTGLTSYGILENASYTPTLPPSSTTCPSSPSLHSVSSPTSSSSNATTSTAACPPPAMPASVRSTLLSVSVPIFNASQRARLHSLFAHYYPLERSSTLPFAARVHHTQRWWAATHQLLVDTRLTRRQLHGAVFHAIHSGLLELRAYFDTLACFLHTHSIPLCIFSAGLHDCIQLALRLNNVPLEHIHIFANKMMFAKPPSPSPLAVATAHIAAVASPPPPNPNHVRSRSHTYSHPHGRSDRTSSPCLPPLSIATPPTQLIVPSTKSSSLSLEEQYFQHQQELQQQQQQNEEILVGFEDLMIHSLNKNYEHVVKSAMYPSTKDRTSVLIVGDSVDDSKMFEGIVNMDECISIGFINDKFDERFNDFAGVYDVVVNGECGMEFVMSLIYSICSGTESPQQQNLSMPDDAQHALKPQFQ